ncbi:hypothetical protein C5167_035253 [Papaver somniferum]|uniref:Uncharacterized protein n=1 Tax=Papaver somniferum TaxID=3469 RepID=A0A4Y7KIR1_PAPSO|nr:hypothetical protein C5167_035253 [Papaver somniferum]
MISVYTLAELSTKRKEHDHVIEPETRKRQASSAENATDSPLHSDKQVEGLKNELDKVELEYEQLLAESKLMDMLKEEKV